MPRALVALLLFAFLLPALPAAQAVPPDALSLLFEGGLDGAAYVKGSTVEAWAVLNFSGTPDPPGLVDNIEFRWYAPTGTLAATATVDPDAMGGARSMYRVTSLGVWSVNATYVGAPGMWANRTFTVVPETWGPGTVTLASSTMIGGNATLTIAANTTVLLDPGVTVRVKGTLDARGAAGEPITFSSSAPTPAAGDWGSLVFLPESGNTSVLEHVVISYGTVGLAIVDGAVTVRNATIANVADTAVDVEGGRLDVCNVLVDTAPVGLALTNATGIAELLTFTALGDAVRANGPGTNVSLETPFFGISTRHVVVEDGGRVYVTGGVFPATGERVEVMGGAELTLRNSLRVLARLYDDNGSSLEAATVEVYADGSPVFLGTTDVNGTTPTLLLPYRRYAPGLTESTIRVRVSMTGLAFEADNRTFALSTSGTIVFRGSAFDMDGDGEPDFSDVDIDGDGLDNLVERGLGTNPLRADTDGDGLPDGWEFDYQQDPRDASNRNRDVDGDGLTTLEEYGVGSDPRMPDTDLDGMPDGWEDRNGLDPVNPMDAEADRDRDGFTNLQEYIGGTDPADASSFPEADGVDAVPFLVAVLAAVAIVTLSLLLRRRGRGENSDEPEGDERADE